MADYLGDCACGCGPGDCTSLRVTATLRWDGWVPFNQDPDTDLVLTKYRTCTVTEAIYGTEERAELLCARELTEAEQTKADNGDYGAPVGQFCRTFADWLAWTYSSTPCPLALYADNGTPVNYGYLAWTAEAPLTRQWVGRLWSGSALWRPINDAMGCTEAQDAVRAWTCARAPYLPPSGYGAAPDILPQAVERSGDLCLAGAEYSVTSAAVATVPWPCETGCAGDCTGDVTTWDYTYDENFQIVGPWPGAPCGVAAGMTYGNVAINAAAWIFQWCAESGATMTPGTPVVSDNGRRLEVTYTNGVWTLVRTWQLSDPWTRSDAEWQAEALLARVDLTAGRTYYTDCAGEITVGCGEGEYPAVSVTEDPVCDAEGTVIQSFTVREEYQSPVHNANLLAARYWDAANNLIVLVKSAATLPAGTDLCTVAYTWASDHDTTPTPGTPDCAEYAGGTTFEIPRGPALLPSGLGSEIWGTRYYQ